MRGKEGPKLAGLFRLGLAVFLGLAALTVVEFAVSQWVRGATPYLALLALVKAGLIARFYMHIRQLWAGEEEA